MEISATAKGTSLNHWYRNYQKFVLDFTSGGKFNEGYEPMKKFTENSETAAC